MRALWISLWVTLIIAFVEAQRTLNLPKPVVSFEKRSRPPIWRRPPEERRNLSIFPKNNKKFVVTERSTLKNVVTTPAVITKRPKMRKLFVQDKLQKDTWSLPPREPWPTYQPKSYKTRNYKIKKDDKIAEESTTKSVVTSVKTKSSVNKGQLNKGNLIQVFNKINEHTNKVSNKQVNKIIPNNDSVKLSSPDKDFKKQAIDVSAENFKENMAATKINEQVEKVTEKVFLIKQVGNVIENNDSVKLNSPDEDFKEPEIDVISDSFKENMTATKINEQVEKVTEKVFLTKQLGSVIENNDSVKLNSPDEDFKEPEIDVSADSFKENMTATKINEQVEKVTEKVFLNKQVGNMIQNNDSMKLNSPDKDFKEPATDVSADSFMENTAATKINEQVEKVTEKVFLTKQVGDVIENNDSVKLNSPDEDFKEPAIVVSADSFKENMTATKINEQVEKMTEKVFLSKQVGNVIQNNDSVKLNSPDKDFKEPAIDVSADSFKENMAATKINEQVEKVTEKVFLSKQVGNVIQNNESSNANSLDTITEEYNIDEGDNDSSQSNVTLTNINEQVNKIIETVFLSKQINNVIKNNDSLKVNLPDHVPDEYVVDKSDSKNSDSTPAEIIKDEENESTAYIFTEDPLSLSKPFKGRSVDSNDLELNEKREHTFLSLNNRKSSNEKTGDSFNLDEILIKDIPKDTNSFSDHRPSILSDDAKPLIVSIQDINTEIVKGQQREFEERPNFYEYKPVIGMENISKITTENIADATVIDIIDKNVIENIEIKANTETNINNINNLMNDLDNLIEAIISNSTSPDSRALTADSQILKLDLNIVEEYTDRSDTMSYGYDETTPKSDYARLTESPIEIIFDNLKTLSAEIKSQAPSLIFVKTVGDEYATNEPTGNIISMVYDSVTENSENIEGGDTSIFSEIINFNVEESTNNNNAKSSIIENLYNLAEVIEAKSTVDDDNEVAISGTQLMNLDMNIVEEYSDQPNVITTEFDGTTDSGSLTESPIEIIFDSQETPSTEKDTIKLDFNENIKKIVGKPVTNELSMIEEIISTVADPIIEASLKIKDGNINTKSEVANFNSDQNHSDNKANRAITQSLPNLVDVVNDHTNVDDKSKVAFDVAEFLIHRLNVDDEDINKPDTITLIVDGEYGPTFTFVGGHGIDASPFRELSLDMNTNKITDEPVTEQFNLTGETITKAEDPVKEVLLKVEDGKSNTKNETENITIDQNANDNADSPNVVKIISDDSNFDDTSTLGNGQTQPINLHINIDEENNDKPNTITIVFDGTTQKTYLNGELVDDAPIGILFDNLEPLGPNNERLNKSINRILDKSVTNQANSNAEDIHETEKSTYLRDKEISDESSTLPNQEMSEEMIAQADHSQNLTNEISNTHILNNSSNSFVTNEEISDKITADQSKTLIYEIPNDIHVLNNSSNKVITQEDISDKMTADESKNLTDKISNKSHILSDSLSSIVANEKIFEEMTADKSINSTDKFSNELHILNDSSSTVVIQEKASDKIKADQSKNLTNEISIGSHVLNDSSNSIETNEEISHEMTADQSKNLTDEISNETHILNDTLINVVTKEGITDGMTADQSNNLTDEISIESHILNDSPSSVVTQEEKHDEMSPDQSKNLNDQISNESHILNDSSSNVVTQEGKSNGITADKSNNLTDEISTKSHILNNSSSSVVTKEEISDEMSADQLKNLTDEILNESHYLSDSSSYTVANAEISDEMTADQSINLADERSIESYMLNDSSISVVTPEDISDETTPGQSKNMTEEISIESHILNDSQSSVVTQEEKHDEMSPDQSKNFTDQISNKSHILNDSSINVVTQEGTSDGMTADQSNNLTDEISTESHILNDSSSSVVTKEEISDEMSADQLKNLTDDILNESHYLSDSSSYTVASAEISDKMTADQSINLADERSIESYMLNDSSISVVTPEDIYDETTPGQSKNMTEEISIESHILNDSQSSVVTQEEKHDEMSPDQSKNFTDQISNKSHILNDSSSNVVTQEGKSDGMTADQSNNLTDEISTESHILNYSSSSVVTKEEISDEMSADQSKNLTDDILNESRILSDISSNTVANEEISDELTADQSKNLTDEISNETHFLNDSFRSVVTQEAISDEISKTQSKNLTDEISNETPFLNDSSISVAPEDISGETTPDQSKNLTDEISNESHVIKDNSSSIVTNQEMSEEIMTADKSKNLTDEISNESSVDEIDAYSDLTGEEKSEEMTEKSKNGTGEDRTNAPAIDIRYPSSELTSIEKLINRIKRSNNIIEEDNLATTSSGFKYLYWV